jgi:hypothetical protein
MAIPKIRDEILEELGRLPEALQWRLLEIARDFSANGLPGTPVKDLLALSGSLDTESARQMVETIEAGCEQVDLDAW